MTFNVDDPDDPEYVLLSQLLTGRVSDLQRADQEYSLRCSITSDSLPFEVKLLQKLDGAREAALAKVIKSAG